ncbi:MAG TPA: ATP-binding protein [Balneolales bacterium]|nr:ATP-binding protein [Balneolales bacterium]
MENPRELKSEDLYTYCNLSDQDFVTTNDLEELHSFIGQDRVIDAVRFGIKMKKDGYNIFALGPDETDKKNLIRHYLRQSALHDDDVGDWCYINNFKEHHKPKILRLPAGKGVELRDTMSKLIDDLPSILTTAFESEEYQNRKQVIDEQNKDEENELFSQISEKAQDKGFALLRTPAGFTFAPLKDDEVMSPEDIQKISDDEREEMERVVEELQKDLQRVLRQMPGRQRGMREQKRELNKEIALYTIKDIFDDVRKRFTEIAEVQEFLDDVQNDIVENVKDIIGSQQAGGGLLSYIQGQQSMDTGNYPPDEHPVLIRYRINVLVNNSELKGAPVIYEDNPTYKNLIGRIEYRAQLGALMTDFNLIKAGALHRANNGYLIVDARKVLMEPFAWEGLKRVLKSGKLRIESPGESYGLISTVSLEPEPVEINVKVILLGERFLYYLLCTYDPDFKDLFKVEADFNDEMDRNTKNQLLYAQMIADMVKEYNLLPMDKAAVARVIEHSSRLVNDKEKISIQTHNIHDLLRESNHWAEDNKHEKIQSEDVQKAIDQQKYRSGRIKDIVQETIRRNTIFVDTSGEKTGQINGLSVLMIGKSIFGRPTRITARVQLGKGEVIDIEREVELSGPIHSKGVMILSGFLGERYGNQKPLSLKASLVFEQSYSGVEGDSASSAELYVLLSAISGVPVKQCFAVTGSVNQHGEIQPIGGVNEKIEGFFDICNQRGLTGEQGVLIPESNVKNLMLRQDVIQAVEQGTFHIYPVQTVDQGMELLTGMSMGERNEQGQYPGDTINHKVEDRLNTLVERRMFYLGMHEHDGRKWE